VYGGGHFSQHSELRITASIGFAAGRRFTVPAGHGVGFAVLGISLASKNKGDKQSETSSSGDDSSMHQIAAPGGGVLSH
jgi:hypothetical protein